MLAPCSRCSLYQHPCCPLAWNICGPRPVAMSSWTLFLPSPSVPGWLRKGRCIPYPLATQMLF